MQRRPLVFLLAVISLIAITVLPPLTRPASAVETTNVDYVAETAIRQLADTWDTAQIAPLFAETHRLDLQSEPVRLSARALAGLGPARTVTEQFRTFSTMSQFAMGGAPSTVTYATRAYAVQFAEGVAKVTIAMTGDGRKTDITLMSIRRVMPQPLVQITLGRPDAHVWSEFERW